VLFVADHGDAFLPLYRLGWNDGVWHPLAGPASVVPPIALTLESLLSAPSAPPIAAAPDEATLAAERARYRSEALALATGLHARAAIDPPRRDAPTGDDEIDALRWFAYVHAAG